MTTEFLKLHLDHSLVDFNEAGKELEMIKKIPLPDFAKFETDCDEIEEVSKKYQDFKNILVVGNGGAINSFNGFYSCLAKNKAKKNVEIINTPEPDFLNELKKLYPKEDTLVLIISKSGTNPTALEIMFYFEEYPKLVVCTEGVGALYEIVKRKRLDYLSYPSMKEFPNLDDRHTGISASGLVPASLLGIDIKGIYQGAKEMYSRCAPSIPFQDNIALQMATAFYILEKKGYVEIFCPIYSTKLYGFLPAIIQFIHETVCKDGQGQTLFGDLAPESHHHTNQRFFGGKNNVSGLFITAVQHDQNTCINIPDELIDIKLRGSTLKDLNKINYYKFLEYEFIGAFRDAIERRIPVIHLEVEKITPPVVGQFLALFQYWAIYSAYLRGVNPLGQPQVERSKEISFELVKKR